MPIIFVKHPEGALMGILKRKKAGRARKEQTFTISFLIFQLGVGWNYSYFIKEATVAQKK